MIEWKLKKLKIYIGGRQSTEVKFELLTPQSRFRILTLPKELLDFESTMLRVVRKINSFFMLLLLKYIIFIIPVPPEEVKIIGEKTVRADRSVSYRCLASNANPAPSVEWTINGKSVTSGFNTFTHPPPPPPSRRRVYSGADEDNISFGWNVSSDLSLDVIGDESQIFLTCQAVSRDHQGQVMTAKAELEVLVLSELLLLLSHVAIFDYSRFYSNSEPSYIIKIC